MKLNVMFFSSTRMVGKGGVGNVSLLLGKEFAKRGIYVYNFAYDEYLAGGCNGNQYFMDIERYNSEYQISRLNWLIEHREIDIIVNQSGFDRKANGIIGGIKEKRVKVVSVHHNCVKCLFDNYREILSSNISILRKVPLPKIVWLMFSWYAKQKWRKSFKAALNNSDSVVFLFQEFKDDALDILRNGKDLNRADIKTLVIPNPYQIEEIRVDYADKEDLVLYVGRLEIVQKRVDILLEVWKNLHKKHKNWSFIVVGDGSAKQYMVDYCNLHNLNRVKFVGWISDPRPFYKRAKIITVTSDFEGTGLVFLEALNYGVIPVSFKCYQSIETIIQTHTNGLVVEKGDISTYIEEVDLLMSDSLKLESLMSKGVNSLERFRSEKVVDQWIKLFSQLRK